MGIKPSNYSDEVKLITRCIISHRKFLTIRKGNGTIQYLK